MMKLPKVAKGCDDPRDNRVTKERELDLIGRAMRGDRPASRELVDLHKQRLFAFVWRIVRDPDMAEDICQDSFLRAFAALKNFDKQYRFSTWLFTIGYRLALNQIKLRARNNNVSYDFANIPAPAQKTQIDAFLQSEHAARLRQIIWDEVDKLAPPQKAAIHMFYSEGLSCRQIGEALDMPVDTVKSHMYRARQKLRARLEHQGIDDRDLAFLGA
jgi:RNA polymerase sigma-70 factor (ECF subfamily)